MRSLCKILTFSIVVCFCLVLMRLSYNALLGPDAVRAMVEASLTRFADEPSDAFQFPVLVPNAAASTLNIPNTFTPGQVIFSSQINANFQAIRSVVNLLDDQNIANASITGSTKLVDGSVPLAKLAADSVNASKIVDGSIGPNELATDAVTTGKILDGTILSGDLADNSVIESKIDFSNAPAINRYVFYDGTKLAYSGFPIGPTACIDTLASRITHAYAAGSQITYSSVGGSATEDNSTTTETTLNDKTYQNNTSMSFAQLRVRLLQSGTQSVPVNTTITVRKQGGPDTSLTCTINSGGATTCSLLATAAGPFSLGGDWDVSVSSSGGSGNTRVFIVTFCASPF